MQVNLRTLKRTALMFGHDTVMAAASFIISLYFRLGENPFNYSRDLVLTGTVVFTLVAAGVFCTIGLYRGVWRYASLIDLVQIVRAVTLTILVFVLLLFLITRLESMPRSSIAINWFVLIMLLGGPRLLYRILKDQGIGVVLNRRDKRRIPVLLVGAGDGAELFIRAIGNNPKANYRVVGLIDDKGMRIGRRIHGLKVMGNLATLLQVVEELTREGSRPQRLIVTEDTLDGARIRMLLDQADELGLTLSRLPKLTDFKASFVDNLKVKSITLEDLLGRPQTVMDHQSMKTLISERRVMVTGAGGTIGGELARQIFDYGPAHLTLLDNSEYALYAIHLELSERHPELGRTAILGDVRDRGRMVAILAEAKPDLVFHAAALKHVPLVEAHPNEAVLINVIGARNVADACRHAGVNAMVLISTDKAVNPLSVMGATKRLAESYCQALDLARGEQGSGKPREGEDRKGDGWATRFLTVRFGNVLGSTGSVVPLFQRQLEAGGPLTITHPEAKRYFMTVREAVGLVLKASVLGIEDESLGGRTFVLDMGEPVRILDLAKQMIRLAGFRPDVDIEIRIAGLRPGEKLSEELFHESETIKPTRYKGVLLASPRTMYLEALSKGLDELGEASGVGDSEKTLALLRKLVPEYSRLDADKASERKPAVAS